MSALLQLCETCTDLAAVPPDWLWSEKLDGMRAWWDGGITRGWKKSDVPWAYCGKDSRLRVPPVSTGLWSRLGGVIQAPDWWIAEHITGPLSDRVTNVTLDGELYVEGLRQDAMSIIKGNGDWSRVRYRVYDSPPMSTMLQARTMWVDKKRVGICMGGRIEELRAMCKDWPIKMSTGYGDRLAYIPSSLRHPQQPVGSTLAATLATVVANGGEGLVVRAPMGIYWCKRHDKILKIKDMDEDEGVVVGVTDGLGRHTGRIGALVVKWKDGVVTLGSGLSDADREARDWINSVVTFRYRGLSRDKQPQEPRYVRRRDYE